MSLSKLKVLGKVQTLDGLAVRTSLDLAETFTIGEGQGGSLLLPKGGTLAKLEVDISHMTNPVFLLIKGDCTMTIEIPAGGTTAVTIDQMAVFGLPTDSGLATWGVTMVSDTTAVEVVWLAGAVGA